MTARRSYRLKAPVVAEHALQAAVCRTLAIEIAAPGRISQHGVTFFCIDHANFAGQVPGVRISRGIIAGIPDLFLLYGGLTHFIELKRLEQAHETSHPVLSEPQQWLLPVLAACGSRLGVARSVAEVLGLLDAWEIPRRRLIKDAA